MYYKEKDRADKLKKEKDDTDKALEEVWGRLSARLDKKNVQKYIIGIDPYNQRRDTLDREISKNKKS